MSPALREFLDATVPVPGLRRDERALQGLPGMAPDEWVMVTLRDAAPGVLALAELFTPRDWRERGFGNAALTWLKALADKHDCSIVSYVQAFGYRPGLGDRALLQWYRRRGFVGTIARIEYHRSSTKPESSP
jgi:GNAT superfamily N-acetyltransferase